MRMCKKVKGIAINVKANKILDALVVWDFFPLRILPTHGLG